MNSGSSAYVKLNIPDEIQEKCQEATTSSSHVSQRVWDLTD
jgi:hypothetical protein